VILKSLLSEKEHNLLYKPIRSDGLAFNLKIRGTFNFLFATKTPSHQKNTKYNIINTLNFVNLCVFVPWWHFFNLTGQPCFLIIKNHFPKKGTEFSVQTNEAFERVYLIKTIRL